MRPLLALALLCCAGGARADFDASRLWLKDRVYGAVNFQLKARLGR